MNSDLKFFHVRTMTWKKIQMASFGWELDRILDLNDKLSCIFFISKSVLFI